MNRSPIPYKPLSLISWCLILFLVFFGLTAHSPQPTYADDSSQLKSDEKLDQKFKALGMIKLSGIQPPVDDFLMDMGGNNVRLSDFKGKIVFLNFWTTWCPDCIYEMPDIEKLHQKMDSKDFIIIALDLKESPEKVSRFIQKHPLSFKVLLDQKGSMGKAFVIRSIPTTFILNRDGGLMGKAMGARSWDSRKSIDLFKYLIETY